MTDHSIERIVDQLSELLQSGTLSARARPTAQRLIERLTSPVRIGLSGEDTAGKATLSRLFRIAQEQMGFAPNITFVDTDASPQGWAECVAQSDMLIWVVTDEADPALASWHSLPGGSSQHAFLIMNATHDAVEPVLRPLNRFQAHGFAAVFRLNLLREQSILERAPLEPMAPTDLERLLGTLKAYVDAGCQADLDGALLFLQRFSGQRRVRAQRSPEPPIAPRQPDASTCMETREVSTARPAATKPGSAPLQHALQRRLSALKSVDLDADDASRRVVQHHLSTLEYLTEIDALPAGVEAIIRRAQDMIMLLQLEDTKSSAVEASLAMLQLKRHLASEKIH